MNRHNNKSLATIMNKIISIQTKRSTPDGEGGFTETWVTISNIWASVEPIKATQVFTYRSIGVEASHLIKIRGSLYINEAQRILFDNRVFEILTIENIQEKGVYSVITCLEVR
jgi:SPP1 family predicted phage head-tail adaptor